LQLLSFAAIAIARFATENKIGFAIKRESSLLKAFVPEARASLQMSENALLTADLEQKNEFLRLKSSRTTDHGLECQ
jgi:hypothetical protein